MGVECVIDTEIGLGLVVHMRKDSEDEKLIALFLYLFISIQRIFINHMPIMQTKGGLSYSYSK